MPETYKIFGPPGTGKTTKMLNLLEYELDRGIEANQIVFLSFTRVAIEEARRRALAKFPDLSEDDLIYFRTMHSMAYRVLGLKHDRVAMGEPLFEFGQKSGYAFEKATKFTDPDDIMFGDGAGSDISLGSYLLSIWDYIRHNLWSLEEGIKRYPQMIYHPAMLSSRSDLVFKDFVKQYETWKQNNGFLDFTDFLKRVMEYHQPLWPPVRVIFSDETQDLSPLQWEVLKLWSESTDDEPIRLYLSADDDQAIFSFMGAVPDLFLKYPGAEQVLPKSWRLSRAVWEYSQRMIQRNRNRRAKEFRYHSEGGSVERISWLGKCFPEFNQVASGSSNESWFILARNRFVLDKVAQQLEEKFIPYVNKRGWSPFESKRLVRACEVAVRLQSGEAPVTLTELNHLIKDYVESQRLLSDGSKQVMVIRGGKKKLEESASANPNFTISRFEALGFGITSDFFEQLDHSPLSIVKFKSEAQRNYLTGSFSNFGPTIFRSAQQLVLSTCHGVKGEEADNVVLLSDVSSSCFKNIQTDPEGERRVFYVGATRARQNLYLVAPQTEKFYLL
jgi:DNA helicase-2/ATP-dependent DNA helicase PcrA